MLVKLVVDGKAVKEWTVKSFEVDYMGNIGFDDILVGYVSKNYDRVRINQINYDYGMLSVEEDTEK